MATGSMDAVVLTAWPCRRGARGSTGCVAWDAGHAHAARCWHVPHSYPLSQWLITRWKQRPILIFFQCTFRCFLCRGPSIPSIEHQGFAENISCESLMDGVYRVCCCAFCKTCSKENVTVCHLLAKCCVMAKATMHGYKTWLLFEQSTQKIK
jgi:hypothetical protein